MTINISTISHNLIRLEQQKKTAGIACSRHAGSRSAGYRDAALERTSVTPPPKKTGNGTANLLGDIS
jgi:hypothetical protein